MNPLGHRKSAQTKKRPRHQSIVFFFVRLLGRQGKGVGSSRKDDVVARLVFRDALVHPVSATERNVVRKRVFGEARVQRGAHLRTARRDGKRAEHVLA